jgi:hypothetical protein
MPATVTQVAGALKTSLQSISGLRVFSYQPEQLNPPVAFPVLSQVDYHRAFKGGNVIMQWQIHVTVGRYTDSRAHALLDDFLSYDGAKSIRAALEADKTLGGLVQSLVLTSGADITTISENGAEFLEIQMALTVHS